MKLFRDWIARRAEARAAASLDARLAAVAADAAAGRRTLRDEIEEWAAEGRDRTAIAGRDTALAFRDLYAEANRWSRWAILHALAPGEPVVLLAAASPHRFAAFVGLSSVAVVPAFLDPTLEPQGLAAAIGVLRPAHVVVDAALLGLFEAAAPHLAHACSVWVHGPHPMAYRRIDEALAGLSPVRLGGRDRRPVAPDATAVLVVHADADHRPHVERLDHGRLAALAMELGPLLGATRDDRLAIVETSLSLETLIAPTVAFAFGAPCRLVPSAGEDAPLEAALAFRPTLLYCDDRIDLSPAPGLRVRLSTRLLDDAEPAPGLAHRRFALRRDGDDLHLLLDGRDIRLPPPGASRS